MATQIIQLSYVTYYSYAGLFVLPSYYEGLPIALLEAMSYGLSCVVSDIPANREVGLPEDRFFQAGDIAGLTVKISEYAGKPLNSEEKALQIKLVADKYDWNKIAEKTWRFTGRLQAKSEENHS